MKKILSLICLNLFFTSLLSCGRGEHMPLVENNNTRLNSGKGTSAGLDAITFADVKPIFQKCISCHGAGKANPTNWLDYNIASTKTIQLMDRVIIKGDMPMGFKLEPQEIKTLATWIKTGALPEPVEKSEPVPTDPTPTIPVNSPVEPPVTDNPIIPQDPNAEPPVIQEPVVTPWPANLISIKSIFDRSCVMCHMGAVPGAPNWQDFTTVEGKKDRIYDRVIVKKDMPMGIEIPDSDREKIKDWLDGKPITTTPWPEKFNDVVSVFETSCKMCHNADSGLPNWLDYAVVESKFLQLRNRLFIKKDMPLGMPLSETDQDKIKHWLDEVSPQE